jgi:hypothetical protein
VETGAEYVIYEDQYPAAPTYQECDLTIIPTREESKWTPPPWMDSSDEELEL